MNEIVKAGLTSYCRIDAADLSPADEADLESFYAAAVGYLAGAGVPEPDFPPKAALGAVVCVREAHGAGRLGSPGRRGDCADPRNPAFRRMLNQLKINS